MGRGRRRRDADLTGRPAGRPEERAGADPGGWDESPRAVTGAAPRNALPRGSGGRDASRPGRPGRGATPGGGHDVPARERRHVAPATVLAIAASGAGLAFVDATIVNVAFPDIQRDFDGTSLSALSWVLNAYNIVFAALLVGAGRLADLLGRKRVFPASVIIFTLASLPRCRALLDCVDGEFERGHRRGGNGTRCTGRRLNDAHLAGERELTARTRYRGGKLHGQPLHGHDLHKPDCRNGDGKRLGRLRHHRLGRRRHDDDLLRQSHELVRYVLLLIDVDRLRGGLERSRGRQCHFQQGERGVHRRRSHPGTGRLQRDCRRHGDAAADPGDGRGRSHDQLLEW